MEILILSSLEKVFADEKPAASEIKKLSALANERASFQAAFAAEADSSVEIRLEGKASGSAKIYEVRNVPVGLARRDDADDFYLRKKSGSYPDILAPVNGAINVKKGEWRSFWIEISPDGGFKGESILSVEITENGGNAARGEIKIEIVDAYLPEQKLIYTNWYHSDCLCNYYGFEPFGDEYWRVNKNFIRTAVEHGMNCILTPIFTPPLDAAFGGERKTVQLIKVRRVGGKYYFDFKNLKKWISECRECGIKYFELSHLFTQWGAKRPPKIVALDRKGREKKIFGQSTRPAGRAYDDFLRSLAPALVKTLEKEGVNRENCFFHVSDEPHINQLILYRRRAEFISALFPGFKIIDALSDFEFYAKGAAKNPVVAENNIMDFYGKTPELWIYYCGGHGYAYLPNRLVAMPSLRTRIIGILAYKYNVKGFLHWGYNFYNSQYSIRKIDPYKTTDAGGAFPSGDSFIVYPGENGEPLVSPRLKTQYEAFQDARALELLEQKVGREKVLELLEDDLFKPLTFMEYPHENEWLLETRERINRAIAENV